MPDEPTPDSVQFDRVLHAVRDLGCDPDGDAPIDDALDEHLTAGTKIEFPAGEYRITRKHRLDDRVGIVGIPGERDDAQYSQQRSKVRFVPPAGESFYWINFNGTTGAVAAGVTGISSAREVLEDRLPKFVAPNASYVVVFLAAGYLVAVSLVGAVV